MKGWRRRKQRRRGCNGVSLLWGVPFRCCEPVRVPGVSSTMRLFPLSLCFEPSEAPRSASVPSSPPLRRRRTTPPTRRRSSPPLRESADEIVTETVVSGMEGMITITYSASSSSSSLRDSGEGSI